MTTNELMSGIRLTIILIAVDLHAFAHIVVNITIGRRFLGLIDTLTNVLS